MGVRSKTLMVVLLVGLVVGVFAVSTQNTQLFKGQIFNGPEGATKNNEKPEQTLLPDLTVSMEVITPKTSDGDIEVDVKMENIGEGALAGGSPYTYSIYIDDREVFTNSDSYSELGPGDGFGFKYPISKTIYKYKNSGTVKVVVDKDNSIKESDESNNEVTKEYNY